MRHASYHVKGSISTEALRTSIENIEQPTSFTDRIVKKRLIIIFM